ncbi:MAG TPA: DsrE family protein [Hyphomonadaceae bacterium]|jgi:intracellular sulfur oxidation DsrE/DsrF family protein|nr:DsrE family protein [Hyphomonadaceae bacterium]
MSFVRFAVLVASVAIATSACGHVKATNEAAAAAPASESYYQFQRVVYQNSGGLPDDRAYFLRVLRNIGAHVAATEGNVEIRLVSFSGAVKVFQQAKSDPELAKAIDAVREKKVRLLVCRNTMRAMNLSVDDVYGVTEADIVPSGVAEIARLQGQGFVYIHP